MEPTLSQRELAKLVDCSREFANSCKQQYAETHKDFLIINQTTRRAKTLETGFALLDKKPTLTSRQLAQFVNCSIGAAHKIKAQYMLEHTEIQKQTNKKIIIFAALSENSNLKGPELAKLANCTKENANTYKRQWLELHGAEPQDEQSAD